MTVDIPYNIGDKINVDGNRKEIRGFDVYINKDGKVTLIRAMIGKSNYVTLKRSRKLRR